MNLGLQAAISRLPAWAREIEQLGAKSESFRSICDDMAAAEGALRQVDGLPEALRAERRREYQSLVESLTAEIESELQQQKVISIAGARRKPTI